MRIKEFASAADTMALWQVISDNTWAAIAQQAEAEAKQKAERAAARKSVSKRGSGKSTAKPAPPKRLPPPLQHVSAPIAKDSKSTADTSNVTSANSKQQSTVQNPSQPLPSTFQPQQPVQPIKVGAVASQAIPDQANLASQTQFTRRTKN